jgi:hypothetical protein
MDFITSLSLSPSGCVPLFFSRADLHLHRTQVQVSHGDVVAPRQHTRHTDQSFALVGGIG